MITQKIHQYPLRVTILFTFIALTVVGQIYMPVPILRAISEDFNVSLSLAGMISSAFSIGYSAGFLFFGPLSDRFGKKVVLLTSFTLFTIVTCTIGMCTDFTYLIFLRILQGFLASSYPPIILSYMNENLPPLWRTKAISAISLGFLTASIIAQTYALLMSHYNFNSLQLFLLPIYILSIISIYFFLSDTTSKNITSRPSLLGVYKMIPALLLEIRYLYLSTLCTLSALVAFYVLLDNVYRVAFSSSKITLFITQLLVLPVMLLSLFSPMFIKKLGVIVVVRWSFIIASAGLLLASFAVKTNHQWLLLISSMIFIGGRSVSVPSLISAITMQVANTYTATAISLYTFTLFLGASMGLILSRLLLSFNNYSLSFLVLAFIAGIPALLTLFIQKESCA